MEIIYHEAFSVWMTELFLSNLEVAGEVQSLIDALERHGTHLGQPEAGPIATSELGLRALRRSPASATIPYAEGPPFVRVLFGFVEKDGETAAVLVLGGDKSVAGNDWYPLNVAEAERRLRILADRQRWRILRIRFMD